MKNTTRLQWAGQILLMRSHNHLDKAAITKAAKKKNSISIDTGYFAFLKHNSTNERFTDKDRHQKIKITSTDKFDDCVLKVSEQLQETISADSGRPGLPLFCGAVDGVDDVLSAYANMALSSEQSTGSADVCAIFFDINPYKIDYFTFRLFLTQISETREEYLRNLFFYMKGEAGLKPEQILEKAARSTVTKEIHADYLIQQTKQKIIRDSANFQTALRDNLRTNILKGLELLNVVRNGRTHYKNLAKSLKKNMELNPKTHWLTDETLYLKVREACAEDRIKALQADLNRGGKQRLLSLLDEASVAGNWVRPSVLYIPKGKKKFSGSAELVGKFEVCIDTIPPQSKRDKHRVWHIIEPERFFSTPKFAHQGELSSRQLMLLTEEYKQRTDITQQHHSRCNMIFLGDVPFGRLYFDNRSRAFLDRIRQYANRYDVRHVALCGDVIDGEHTREKRKLALLQFLSDNPLPSIEQQCSMAADFVSRFKGSVYSVTSDGDWDIIEEKQRELINHKEFQYKIEKNTSHIPDHVRKSLRVEAIFEAAKEYYDYVERQIPFSEKIGDSLNLCFDTANVQITHMSLGQYFRKSLTKSVGVKEQQIINQFLALRGSNEQKDIEIKVSSHDNVLQAHMETEKTLNLKVPSLESSTQYESIPIQLRNAVQDMMHKAFSVRGKIPFLSSCKVEVTDDGRILLTVINEKLLDMLEIHKDKLAEEYLIFNLADAQIGSIAYRYDYLIKYLDYVKSLSERLQRRKDLAKVGRIALFNGDVIEGMNYPTAMMRNAPTKLVIPQTQINYTIEVLKPFFFTERNGQTCIDKDIEHIILTHGNHEYNSGFIHSGMMATQTLLQYFKGHLDREYDQETVKRKLMYSLFVSLDRNRTLFTSIGAFSKLGLNVHMMHSYGGRPNPATATPPQERWVTRIGSLAKPWDILIQGHYHKLSLGEVAGKVLFTFPSFTEVSDFEYERGLDSPVCQAVLHLSSRYGLVVEILTRKFLDSYKCQHPMFKKTSIRRFHDRCVDKATEPADLTGFC